MFSEIKAIDIKAKQNKNKLLNKISSPFQFKKVPYRRVFKIFFFTFDKKKTRKDG
jgi:hypothetical protein|tara:strand:+ start:208 stop:372 length:165 start_codon:yes stop_codon:yes gene_type:complete